MNVRDLVEWARDYEDADDATPAEAMLSVLIELYTCDVLEEDEVVDQPLFHRAWVRLTRDLDVPEWLHETQSLARGVDVLAANLTEIGRTDLAIELRELSASRFDGAASSSELNLQQLRRPEEPIGALDQEPLWVPRKTGGWHPQGA